MNRAPIRIVMASLVLGLSAASQQPCAAAEPARNAKELLSAFSSVPHSWQQMNVAEEMISLGDKSLIQGMEAFLTSESRRERCNAALVLAALGDDRGSAIILREFNDKEPRPTKLRRSDGKPDPRSQIIEDRSYAAFLLARLKERSAVSALIEALNDERLTYRVAISLGEIGDPSAIPALLTVSRNDPRNRLWAGYGLAKLGEQTGFDILIETLSDSHWVPRRHAVEGLGDMGDPRMAPHLIKALKDERVQVRVSAAVSLGKIGDESAVPPLQEALKVSEINQKNEGGLIDANDLIWEGRFPEAGNSAIDSIKARANKAL
jgi:HEAT repeat protein